MESREPRTSFVDLDFVLLDARNPAELWSPWIKFHRFGREFSEIAGRIIKFLIFDRQQTIAFFIQNRNIKFI